MTLQVTVATLPVLLASFAPYAAGGVGLSIAGVLVMHVGLVLDQVDGDLARATGKASPRGEFLDALVGYLYGAGLPPAIGYGVSRVPDLGHEAISSILDIPAEAYLQIGLWAGIGFLTTRLISLRYQTLFAKSLREGAAGYGRAAMIFSSTLPLVYVVGAATQFLSLVLLAHAMFALLSLLYMIVGSYLGSASASGGPRG